MAEEVLGSGFNKDVKRQLKAREDLVNLSQKSREHLLFFNSNNAWIRLSSSVNTLTKDEVEKLEKSKDVQSFQGSNTLANNNILKNGLTENRGELKGSINTDKNYSPTLPQDQSTPLRPGDPKSATYHNYSSLGFRPEPGITGATVKSKNTYGTLREAEVSFNVWTLEDLELLQALYLRPGYSVLLEWGHTVWIEGEGDSIEINSTIYNFNEFTEKKIPQSKIYEKIFDYRSKSNNNYDAMYGYVSNFSWSFRQDGGYDCTVKILSRGQILESLSATFEPSGRLGDTKFRFDSSEDQDDKNEDGYIERISVFHKFAQEVVEGDYDSSLGVNEKTKNDFAATYKKTGNLLISAYNTYVNSTTLLGRDFLDDEYAKAFKEKLINFTAFDYDTDLDDSGTIFDDSIVSTIVPLYTILDIFNNFGTTIDRTETDKKDKQVIRFYTGVTDSDPQSKQYEKVCKYLTSKYHFSSNPVICVIPRPTDTLKVDDTEYQPGYVFRKAETNHDLILKSIENGRGETDDILNLYVGLYPLLTKIQQEYESSVEPEKGFLQILRELLDQINDVLGGVNELDIHYDEDDNMHYIVDRKLTPAFIEKASTINLTGLKSTISNLNISSKITPNISSMISIAAQGSGGNSKKGVEAMLEWNRGLIDRHTPDKSSTEEFIGPKLPEGTPTVTNSRLNQKKKKRLKDFLDNAKDAFGDFMTNDYDPPKFDELKSYHKEFCNEFVTGEFYKDSNGNKKRPVPGLIPIELSFDTIGIGGLKIGQAFNISEGILPKMYTDNFGFLITGLDHTIQNNKWITSVKTQFFPKRK